jgi:hypothetical protein
MFILVLQIAILTVSAIWIFPSVTNAENDAKTINDSPLINPKQESDQQKAENSKSGQQTGSDNNWSTGAKQPSTPAPRLGPTFLLDLTRVRQVSFGIMMGLFIILVGTTVSLLGIEASVSMKASGSGFGFDLTTASPGIVLIVAGTFIVGACVIKPYGSSYETGYRPGDPATPGVGAVVYQKGVTNFSDTSTGFVGFIKAEQERLLAIPDSPEDNRKWVLTFQNEIDRVVGIVDSMKQSFRGQDAEVVRYCDLTISMYTHVKMESFKWLTEKDVKRNAIKSFFDGLFEKYKS